MGKGGGDKFSAGEQDLGYLYQLGLALLCLLDLPENIGVLIEGEGDLDLKRSGEGSKMINFGIIVDLMGEMQCGPMRNSRP